MAPTRAETLSYNRPNLLVGEHKFHLGNIMCSGRLLLLHWTTKFNFLFGTRWKISNPNRTFNVEFKYVSSFSPSPTVFFVTAKLSVKEMCIFMYYIHYSPT